MEPTSNEIINFLLNLENNLAIAGGIAGVSLIVYHFYSMGKAQTFKEKFDYKSKSQTNIIWYTFLSFLIAATLVADSFLWFDESEEHLLSLYIAEMITVGMFAVIVGYTFRKWLEIYYPAKLYPQLERLRSRTRISPKSNKPMKLLTEEEEDVHLSEGMQAEEDILSVDYDVWVDEETGYVQIEKYEGNFEVESCPECGFMTFTDVKEEILDSPTTLKKGRLLKHFKCGYCNYGEKRYFKVARLEPEKIEQY